MKNAANPLPSRESLGGGANEVKPGAGGTPDPTLSALSALRSIAEWQVSLGNASHTPFGGLDFDGIPEPLRAQGEMLKALTYGDLMSLHAAHQRAVNALLKTIFAEFTERETAILLERILADRPTTLQVLGQRFGVSHQRIAQLERDFRARVTDNLQPGTHFGDLLGSFVKRVGQLMPLPRLLEASQELEQLVPGTAIPVWKLVDRVYDRVEIRDGWFASPSIDEMLRATRFAHREASIWPGVAVMGAHRGIWPFTDAELDDWCRICGFVTSQDFAVDPATNVSDALAQVLAMSSGPQSADSLGLVLASLGDARSSATVAAALRDDRRFLRSGDGRWSLRDMPIPYTDVIHTIERTVRAQGPTPLSTILEACADLDRTPESIATYARYGHLTTVDGLVRLREKAQPVVFPPAEAPAMYRIDGGWAHLTTLGAPDVAAGVVQVSTGIAALLGLESPGSHDIASLPGASVTFANTVTVRLPDETMRKLRVGDRVLLWFGFGAFEVRMAEPVDSGLTGAAQALNLFGLPATGDPDADLRRVAEVLDVPAGSDPRTLVAVSLRKREFEAARVLGSL